MATPQLSPGILVREIDLTVGRVDNVVNNIGGIAGPFQLGPVDEPIEVSNQAEYLDAFGKPLSTDRQYEYWMSGSSYLTYGGVLKVVRTDGSTLNNANAGVAAANDSSLKIKNNDDYEESYQTSTDFFWAAKNPGTWANGLKVCVIDNLADQRIGLSTTGFSATDNLKLSVGMGVSHAVTGVLIGNGTTSEFTGTIRGIITGINTSSDGNSSIDVKVISRVSSGGTVTDIDYAKSDKTRAFQASKALSFNNSAGVATDYSINSGTVSDWYDQQQLALNTPIYWNTIAGRPVDSNYSDQRSGGGDGIHVVVVDDNGSVTGIQGNILEKHTFLSKAKDAVADGNAPTKTYYKDYLINGSQYVFAGYSPSNGDNGIQGTRPSPTGFSTYSGQALTPYTTGEGQWGQDAQGIQFAAIGNKTYTMGGGVDYSAAGGFAATLGDLQTSYELFANDADVEVDFLIMGPGLTDKEKSQAKANQLISIAESRKDCMAVISPHRADVVGQTVTSTQMNNILEFYSPLSSSSYAVFDTGWKYTYDRFNNAFVYVPCNADVAGTMVRTEIETFPWFSPAGVQRGSINDAVKLAYNPSKSQRDSLYGARINPIINKKGSGIILFGDKTGLGYASAFDRINVRRLFLSVEQAVEAVADSQLFELNDETTRANFVNAVEPYLRDVQAKRGLYDFVVKCDDKNNTPDIIDNNEFRADIFLKPTKSINYVTLTFVATRTGVDFEEVVGTV
jgi:phage tail sheath protein FI